VGIPGNELADITAKNAAQQPLILKENFNIQDILKHIKNTHKNKMQPNFDETSTWYQSINHNKLSSYHFFKNNQLLLSRGDHIKITRL